MISKIIWKIMRHFEDKLTVYIIQDEYKNNRIFIPNKKQSEWKISYVEKTNYGVEISGNMLYDDFIYKIIPMKPYNFYNTYPDKENNSVYKLYGKLREQYKPNAKECINMVSNFLFFIIGLIIGIIF